MDNSNAFDNHLLLKKQATPFSVLFSLKLP